MHELLNQVAKAVLAFLPTISSSDDLDWRQCFDRTRQLQFYEWLGAKKVSGDAPSSERSAESYGREHAEKTRFMSWACTSTEMKTVCCGMEYNTSVSLTPLQAKIVAALMGAHPRRLKKEELRAVWTKSGLLEPDNPNLDATMTKVRKALEPLGVTCRGAEVSVVAWKR